MPIVLALLLLYSLDEGRPVKDAAGEIVELDLTGSWVSDADMAKVAQLRHLRNWKHLERLNLRGTRVTSKVFDSLSKMTSLRSLDIGFTQVEDEGFDQL